MNPIEAYLDRREEITNIYEELLMDIYEHCCKVFHIEDDLNYDEFKYPIKRMIKSQEKDFIAQFLQIHYNKITGEKRKFRRGADIFKYCKQYAKEQYSIIGGLMK